MNLRPSFRPRFRPSALFILACALAGCASTPNIGTDVLTSGMPNPEVALTDSMHLVDAEMTKLGTFAPPARAAEVAVPDELHKQVTFAYSGPLDEGARKLATAVGYKLVVLPPPVDGNGRAPEPLTVNVTTGFVTALQAFQILGDAAGERAMVRVDPRRHLVEVDHHA